MNARSRDRVVAATLGLATAFQGALLSYLSSLHWHGVLQVCLVAVLLGWAIAEAWLHRYQLNHRVDMGLVMASLGGLGMLLGWWLDAGAGDGPLALECACSCVSARGIARSLASFMIAGMLIGSVPASFALTRCAERARRSRRRWVATHLIGNLAMIAGMLYAGRWAGRTFGMLVGSAVVGAHLAMLVGMVAGMTLGMWLGEAMLGLRPWRETWADTSGGT